MKDGREDGWHERFFVFFAGGEVFLCGACVFFGVIGSSEFSCGRIKFSVLQVTCLFGGGIAFLEGGVENCGPIPI